MVYLCISKLKKGGEDVAIFDIQRSGHPSEIINNQYCMSENNGSRLCTGTLDIDCSPQIHSKECRGSGISKAFNSYQAIYSEISQGTGY